MLSIKGNEIETNDSNIFQLTVDYMMISQFMYRRLVKEYGKMKAKDFMERNIVKWVAMVDDTEE